MTDYTTNTDSLFTCHLYSCTPKFLEAKNLLLSSSDLNLVNFSLRTSLQQKMYHQEIIDVGYLKHNVTLLDPISHTQ